MTQTTHSDHVIHRDSHARLSRWPLGMFPSHYDYDAWPCKDIFGLYYCCSTGITRDSESLDRRFASFGDTAIQLGFQEQA
jgi:hypothetical protein